MWWGSTQATPEAKNRNIPRSPVSVGVNDILEFSPACAGSLAEGIRKLYSRSELCDIVLVAHGQRFPAHKAMLAAVSEKFRLHLQYLDRKSQNMDSAVDPLGGLLLPICARPASAEAPPESNPAESIPPTEKQPAVPDAQGSANTPAPVVIDVEQKASNPSAQQQNWLEVEVSRIESAEAVRVFLSYVYDIGTGGPWEYRPSSKEVNRDILRLARHFGLTQLQEYAARWLAAGLTTANVVEHLATCDEFNLGALKDKILEQLTANPAELAIVSSSSDIMKHPRILQELLVQVARLSASGNGNNQDKEKTSEEEVEKDKAPEVERKTRIREKMERPAKKTKKGG